MLSREQVSEVVRDRDTYYDGMLRNGWLLPAKKQSLCTLDFMQRVRAGEIFCPRASHVKVPPVCVTPPPKAVLIDKIATASTVRAERGEDVKALDLLLERLYKKKSADTPFLVLVLHLVDPADEIFARDYVYQRPQQVKPQVAMPVMDNSDGFYNGLPKLDGRGRQQLRLTKAQKDAMQLELLEQRQLAMAAKISALRARVGGGGGQAAAQN